MSSDTRTMTLTDFILDRLADLELAAQVALATAPSEPIEGITPAGAVWFTPEQVLADVAAKRRIVELHFVGDPGEWDPGQWACRLCQWDEDCDSPKQDHQHGAGRFPCDTLRALAAVYADHPDHRPEWRP